jgi:tryptophan 2,3-dioxygenase
MGVSDGLRRIEQGVRVDFSDQISYGEYLELDRLLSAQRPRSSPPHHDETLFIIAHQTSELWLKLVLHELRAGRSHLEAGDLQQARKCIARVGHVLRTMTDQWSVLATLTPHEYAQFRGALAHASGFQSWQYRAVEFILASKNREMLAVFAHSPAAHDLLSELLAQPTVYDAFLRALAHRGHELPRAVIDRDVSAPWVHQPALVPVFERIYSDVDANWEEYATCEDLVDLEDAFQLWRFRHLRTVQRTIGLGRGTGGSSGVGFLRAALELTFFPELFSVRTAIGERALRS